MSYIWVSGWEDFQTFQKKRDKPWVPPWIKLAPALLDDPNYLRLSPQTRTLLVGIWMLFARSRGTVTKDTRRLSRQLHQRVTERQLESLNHAGYIEFCSRTVQEQRRDAFWNRSILEVDKKREEQPSFPPTWSRPAEGTEDSNNGQSDDFPVPVPLPLLRDFPA